jgi:transposase
MVELVHAGRTPAQLAREFNVTAQSISSWVAQAAADSGKLARGKDVLSTPGRRQRQARPRQGCPEHA